MQRSNVVSWTDLSDGIRLIEVDYPPVNALSAAVRGGLLRVITEVQSDPAVHAVVIACAGRTFIAGADIHEFGMPDQPPSLPEVTTAIEASKKPVVAALHGSALGGGLEVALACHARVAQSGASLGLPEVTLGLMPGAGGTQRLPRLIGLKASLDMILSGKPIGVREALESGLVDEVVDGDPKGRAIESARRLATEGRFRRTGDLAFPVDETVDFAAEERRVATRLRGQTAPPAILEVLRTTQGLSIADGLSIERAAFLKLRATPESAALRYAFFAERARTGGSKGGGERTIGKVAVVGAGTMGQGIAIALAESGLTVTLVESDSAAFERARQRLARHFEGQARRKPEAAARTTAVAARIQIAADLAAAGEADLVIEAVFEDLQVKRTLFRQLEGVVRAGTLLASNTSYLDLDDIAGILERPADFLGLHFFSPANVMKLVEVVCASATSDEAVATGLALGRRLGKVPVPMRNGYGFTGNRMLARRTREAYFLLEEGALPWDVDRVLQAFGFRMGPFRVGDLAGLDIGWRNRHARLASLGARERDCTILDQMVDRGWLGQKVGRGYYRYDDARTAIPNPDVEHMIVEHSARVGIERRGICDQEILERCLYPMINEAAAIIDEGIVERAEDVDLVWLHGYGFPRYRGGPLYWADRQGLSAIVEAMDGYAVQLGKEYWPVAAGLRARAERGEGFVTNRKS